MCCWRDYDNILEKRFAQRNIYFFASFRICAVTYIILLLVLEPWIAASAFWSTHSLSFFFFWAFFFFFCFYGVDVKVLLPFVLSYILLLLWVFIFPLWFCGAFRKWSNYIIYWSFFRRISTLWFSVWRPDHARLVTSQEDFIFSCCTWFITIMVLTPPGFFFLFSCYMVSLHYYRDDCAKRVLLLLLFNLVVHWAFRTFPILSQHQYLKIHPYKQI